MNATETTEGIIPHYPYRGIDCPVKLATVETRNRDGMFYMIQMGWVRINGEQVYRPVPLRNEAGALVYALPGRGIITEGEA